MTLGDILKISADKDLAGEGKNKLVYSELVLGDTLKIKLSSLTHKEAFVECSIPFKDSEEETNYLRTYFLSMVFNAAIHGMKRMKHKKIKRK